MRLTPDVERTMRRYVLGDLEEEVLRSELEELLITDPEAFEALGVIEDELVEEYLDETGSPAERQSLERCFLSSPGGGRRLRFARTLRACTSAPTLRSQPATLDEGHGRARPWAWPKAWVGLAATLALSLVGNVWQASQRERALAEARLKTPEEQQGARAPMVAFTLAAGLLRGGGSVRRMSVPKDVAVVQMRLELPGDDYPLYRAALLDANGDEIWTASKLRAEGPRGLPAAVLWLPSGLLSRGDYQLKLSGVSAGGEREAVATYPFRVSAAP